MKSISSVGIIGYGAFGKFLHEVISTNFPHVEVLISSRSYEGAADFSDVCKASLIIPCVPIRHFEDTLKRMVSVMGDDSIVLEVCTVKTHPLSCLQKFDGLHYISTHPMFGPESYKKIGKKLDGLRMVISEHSLDDDTYTSAKELLSGLGLHLIEKSADQHDTELASTLFLTHYVSQVIYTAGFDRTEIDTLSFGFLMDAVESVHDDVQLFHDVRTYNPYCKEIVEKFKGVQECIETELRE